VGARREVAGLPDGRDTTAGSTSSPIANASSENGRRVWLTAKGPSVRARSSASMARSRSGATSDVPMLPRAPASQTAAVSSTLVHGPSDPGPDLELVEYRYALRSERPAASS
jgi:hypothetical protein